MCSQHSQTISLAMQNSHCRKELDSAIRTSIVHLHQAGMAVRKIAVQLGLPKSTVGDTVCRFALTGSANPKKRTGRPAKMTERLKRYMVRHVQLNRRARLRQVTAYLRPLERTN